MANEYDIPIEENLRKDVSVMCNLISDFKKNQSKTRGIFAHFLREQFARGIVFGCFAEKVAAEIKSNDYEVWKFLRERTLNFHETLQLFLSNGGNMIL